MCDFACQHSRILELCDANTRQWQFRLHLGGLNADAHGDIGSDTSTLVLKEDKKLSKESQQSAVGRKAGIQQDSNM